METSQSVYLCDKCKSECSVHVQKCGKMNQPITLSSYLIRGTETINYQVSPIS